jgi:hypothetical protein
MAKAIADSKDKERARQFLDALERQYVVGKAPAQWSREDVRAIEQVGLARDYIGNRGSSTKLLLEYVALALPIIKASKSD